MKKHSSLVVRLLFGSTRPVLAAGALVILSTSGFAQVTVNPDPELFDGSKTKQAIPQDQQKSKIDDWEGPNLIVYDSDKQGADGGIGRSDSNIAGNDIEMPGGGGGGMPGIPMSGGGPSGGEKPGQIPTAQQSTPGAGSSQEQANTAGAAESTATKPSEVAIGDNSKKISTASRNQASADPSNEGVGENDSKKTSEDTTEIPSSASGKQSGGRAGGVEKGVGMPTNL